ncbi:MAG: DUF3347 domain-containing protein [Bacteroidetes bacterium]|nr:MAG: DUF3347 domain-containing protein [Bacteroidota bacterium]
MKPYITLSIASLIMFACTPSGEETSTESTTEVTSTESVNSQDNHATAGAVDAYLSLKDALFNSNAEQSAQAASKLKEELSGLEETDTLLSVIIVASDSLSASKNLDLQRSAFEVISDNMYLYLKQSGTGRSLYRQFCPMAFDFKGAYWISDQEAIANPYFGDEMPTCGAVKETL